MINRNSKKVSKILTIQRKICLKNAAKDNGVHCAVHGNEWILS